MGRRGPGKGPDRLRPILEAPKGLTLHEDRVGDPPHLLRLFLRPLKTLQGLGIVPFFVEEERLVELLLRRGLGPQAGFRRERSKQEQEEEGDEEKDR
jgi:hypothetical protein